MIGTEERFEFTWDGNDECDPASGAGWVKVTSQDQREGKFRFHMGDSSKFLARRVAETHELATRHFDAHIMNVI